MRAALRGWQVNEPPLPVCDAQIDDLPAVAQLVSLPHFGFYSLSSPTRCSPGREGEEEGERGEGSRCQESVHTHSFSYLHATCLHVKKKKVEKKKKKSLLRAAACVELRVHSTRVVSSSEGLRASAAPRTPEPPNIKAHWEPSRHKDPIYAEITRCKSFQEKWKRIILSEDVCGV